VLGGMSFGVIAATACYLYIASLERAAHGAPGPETAPAE